MIRTAKTVFIQSIENSQNMEMTRKHNAHTHKNRTVIRIDSLRIANQSLVALYSLFKMMSDLFIFKIVEKAIGEKLSVGFDRFDRKYSLLEVNRIQLEG